jgi:hypothetical protein
MVPLAKSNKYLRSRSLTEVTRENASASSAFEGVPASARGGAVYYHCRAARKATPYRAARSLKAAACSKKSAKSV